ncbi:Tim44-like domain-containing protein [Halomonas sp.]|uniref:Tim44 domain-containing protein n=1 Tax=Halomonas sp. TaxID=1486246 RepID=UPI00235608EF|nr:Tim44-like domain-containing protein [Halomonas sp.]
MTSTLRETSPIRHLLIILVAGLLTLGPAIQDAEARRLGGGKSFGSQSRSVQQQPSATQGQATGSRAGQGRAGSRMPGMLSGLLAGGLLAALFFGGAFDELRLMDMLMMAGIAFLLFRLLARRRTAMAGGPSPAAETPRASDIAQPFQASTAPAGGAFASEPEWFDRDRFLGDAKEHFMTLQRAWDNNNLGGIQEYVTPALYNLLREERKQHPANNRTEVVRLFAELGMVQELGQHAEASVIFHGILDENGEHNEFNETWHLTRELRDGAPWHVQGIEQNG